MRLFIPSFGMGAKAFTVDSYFRLMPALSLWTFGPLLVPDYPIYLLFEEFYIDKLTFVRIHDVKRHAHYAPLTELLDALEACGRLKTLNVENLIKENEDPIRKSVKYDMQNLGAWSAAFNESASIWDAFCISCQNALARKAEAGMLTEEEERMLSDFDWSPYSMMPVAVQVNIASALKKWHGAIRKDQRRWVRIAAEAHFRYIASTLCAADVLNAAIHDWADMDPLYRMKLGISLRSKSANLDGQQQARKLFQLFWPGFRPKSGKAFVRALDDKRAEELRAMINAAANGDVAFDEKFAMRTFQELFTIDKKILFKRKLAGWLTLPLGFIPWIGTPLQKVAEETYGAHIQCVNRKDKQWFYLLSDIEVAANYDRQADD